jgi:hypothetical protein
MAVGAAYLLDRLKDGAKAARQEDRWAREDVEDLTLEVAEFAAMALDVQSLDRELVTRAQLDTPSIRWLVQEIEKVAEVEPSALHVEIGSGSRTVLDWRARLERLKLVLSSLESPQQLDQLEVSLRIGLGADGAVDTLLAALPPAHSLKSKIEARLHTKLSFLTDQAAMDLWAHLRFEVDPDREVHFRIDDSVVQKEFFDLGSSSEVRGRIARYLALVRPALERQMIVGGSNVFPTGLTGIVTILSWTDTPSTRDWKPRTRAVVRGLCRVAALWTGDKGELAGALGVPLDGYFVGGRGEDEARRSRGTPSRQRRDQLRLVDELTKLVRIAQQERAHAARSVERALRAFKLGMEVSAEDHLEASRLKDELYLQRVLLKFLVEREITAFGTRFGRSEVDVRAEDTMGSVVVEAKVLRVPLTEPKLNRWLTQLGSYMDQSHVALRGALVIFNFADSPILAPETIVGFRFLIVAINLCRASPSKRSSGVQVEGPAAGSDGVRVVRLGHAPKARRSTAAGRKPRHS